MTPSTSKPSGGTALRRLAHWIIPIFILILGAGIAMALVKHPPRAKRTPPQRQARLVETMPVELTSATTLVHAMGTVLPATEVEVSPRVAGEIVEMADALTPGGRVAAGQTLVKIDAADYELAYRRTQSEVASVESDLALEQGRQAVAEQEFTMLGMEMSGDQRDRVLRKPQLDKLHATLATATAQQEQAALNLARTEVTAPFNAVVRERHVNLGTQVSTATRLATLVGTDIFWIEVTVPVRELRWIRIPGRNGATGAPVTIYNETAWAPGIVRTGEVVRLLSELEPQGRMARLLVAVEDPLSLASGAIPPPLLLGEYVRVEIEGSELDDVAVLDRRLVRAMNTVWLLTDESTLEIRDVGIAYESRDAVYVERGLSDGERIVVTDLSSPVNAMPLRTAADGGGSPPADAVKEQP